MKKGKLLNSDLSRIISLMGHTDILTVADAGLPIPDGVERVDLALVNGLPSFMQVVDAITQEMQVESVIIAQEIKTYNPAVHEQLLQHLEALQQSQGNQISIKYVSHTDFKILTKQSKAVVRSGECSPYANIHFISGVTF